MQQTKEAVAGVLERLAGGCEEGAGLVRWGRRERGRGAGWRVEHRGVGRRRVRGMAGLWDGMTRGVLEQWLEACA